MPETLYSKIITVGVLTELIVIFIITFTHETNGIQTLNSCVWGGVRSYKIDLEREDDYSRSHKELVAKG